MAQHPIASLTYDAAFERLSGRIGAHVFHVHAWSGGGRGSTQAGVASSDVASYMSTTKTARNKNGHYVQRGGTLPEGKYHCEYLAGHPHFGECIRLHMDHATRTARLLGGPAHGRDGFFIHGRGVHGSDGCIVPQSNSERHRLNRAVRDFAGEVVVRVVDVAILIQMNVRGEVV